MTPEAIGATTSTIIIAAMTGGVVLAYPVPGPIGTGRVLDAGVPRSLPRRAEGQVGGGVQE